MDESTACLCFFCKQRVPWQEVTGFWCPLKHRSSHPGTDGICEADAHGCHRDCLRDSENSR
jgi:hypothetical protein